jgi:hypothetical protein
MAEEAGGKILLLVFQTVGIRIFGEAGWLV